MDSFFFFLTLEVKKNCLWNYRAEAAQNVWQFLSRGEKAVEERLKQHPVYSVPVKHSNSYFSAEVHLFKNYSCVTELHFHSLDISSSADLPCIFPAFKVTTTVQLKKKEFPLLAIFQCSLKTGWVVSLTWPWLYYPKSYHMYGGRK